MTIKDSPHIRPKLEPKVRRRNELWDTLRNAGVARFPGARGRHPNFTGAEDAAARLAETKVWKAASVVLVGAELAQRPVRRAAIQGRKKLFVALPGLRGPEPLFRLDPDPWLLEHAWEASSIKGALQMGRPSALGRVLPVDLLIFGSVGVDRSGTRLGRGDGALDLLVALGSERGWIGAQTSIATTVHPLQLLGTGALQAEPHDVPVDWIVTPDGVHRCRRARRRPARVRRTELSTAQLRDMPILSQRGRRATG